MKKDIKDTTMITAALATLASGIVMCFLSFFSTNGTKSVAVCFGISARRCCMLHLRSAWPPTLRQD